MAIAKLIDDSYWRSIDINSTNGTVCSYSLQNSDKKIASNVFEVQISQLKNVQLGIYYGQFSHSNEKTYNKLSDMKLFDP